MATIKRFEEIEAWQVGRSLVNAVYALTKKGGFARDWGLRDQIQRATVSVCSNIAEGFERCGNKEFAHFLWIAKGSAGEVASQLYHAKDNGYITESEFQSVTEMTVAVRGKLHNFIKALNACPDYGQRNVKPQTSNLKPQTSNVKRQTSNVKPLTLSCHGN